MKLRRTEIIVSIVIVLVASAMFATVVRFSAVWTTVCAICGAREQQTRWVFGFKSTPVRESSPLAQWLSRQGRAHEHRWEHLHVGDGMFSGVRSVPVPRDTSRRSVQLNLRCLSSSCGQLLKVRLRNSCKSCSAARKTIRNSSFARGFAGPSRTTDDKRIETDAWHRSSEILQPEGRRKRLQEPIPELIPPDRQIVCSETMRVALRANR